MKTTKERINIRPDKEKKGFGKGKESSQDKKERTEEDLSDSALDEGDLGPVSESDLTAEDFEALGPIDLSMDGGYDEPLQQRTHPVDFAGRDLDIPGTELDDDSEMIGNEDEENNSWSLGGDNHENLEETDGGR